MHLPVLFAVCGCGDHAVLHRRDWQHVINRWWKMRIIISQIVLDLARVVPISANICLINFKWRRLFDPVARPLFFSIKLYYVSIFHDFWWLVEIIDLYGTKRVPFLTRCLRPIRTLSHAVVVFMLLHLHLLFLIHVHLLLGERRIFSLSNCNVLICSLFIF